MRRIHPRTPAWRLFGTALVLLALAEAGAAQETAAPSLSVEGERTSSAAEFERLLPMLGDPITADDALCAIRRFRGTFLESDPGVALRSADNRRSSAR